MVYPKAGPNSQFCATCTTTCMWLCRTLSFFFFFFINCKSNKIFLSWPSRKIRGYTPSTSLLWTPGFNTCFIACVEFFFPLILELRLSKFKDIEVKMTSGCSISHHEVDCYELIGFCCT